jgi:hypothetical protein
LFEDEERLGKVLSTAQKGALKTIPFESESFTRERLQAVVGEQVDRASSPELPDSFFVSDSGESLFLSDPYDKTYADVMPIFFFAKQEKNYRFWTQEQVEALLQREDFKEEDRALFKQCCSEYFLMVRDFSSANAWYNKYATKIIEIFDRYGVASYEVSNVLPHAGIVDMVASGKLGLLYTFFNCYFEFDDTLIIKPKKAIAFARLMEEFAYPFLYLYRITLISN